jgi:GNAT superfamily N-acetyltransferase
MGRINALQIAVAGGRAGFRQFARHTRAAEWVERPGVILLTTGSRLPLFNGLALTGERALDDGLLAEAERAFASRGLRYSVRFEEALLPQAAAFLEERDYISILNDPARVLLGPPASLPANAAAQIDPVQSARDMAQYRDVMRIGFGIPADEAALLMGDDQAGDPVLRNYLARLDRTVVGAGTFVLSDGVVGVWNVATLPDYRRQGIATALMQRGLRDAYADGATASTLWSSKSGYRLYERLGYQPVTRVRGYVPPA